MVESALPGPSSVFWWLASEDWLDHWAGLQAEVRVSCELIWAWNSQRAWLLLCGHVEELGRRPGAKVVLPMQIGMCGGGIGVHVLVCLCAILCSGWSKAVYMWIYTSEHSCSHGGGTPLYGPWTLSQCLGRCMSVHLWACTAEHPPQ